MFLCSRLVQPTVGVCGVFSHARAGLVATSQFELGIGMPALGRLAIGRDSAFQVLCNPQAFFVEHP